MIVSDDTVSKALAYLAEDPHPLALARYELTKCENHTKEIYSIGFLQSSGTSAAAREADAISDGAYGDAKEMEAEAVKEMERHRARVKAAEMIIEVWRSENANARAAERVR